jgi:septal ring factor EnvC (AmiA/AmiB activator)
MSEVDIALERVRWEGRLEATVEGHTRHLEKLNGSIDRWATASEDLKAGVNGLAGEIQEMRSEARLAQERVRVAAETLAKETERRREEAEAARVERAAALEIPARKWDILSNKANVAYAFIGLLAFALSIYAVLLGSGAVG